MADRAQIRDTPPATVGTRWKWYLSLATEHGILPDVVAAEVTTPYDRLDVIEPAEHDDDRLRKCMTTLCSDVRVQQRQCDYESGRWVPCRGDAMSRPRGFAPWQPRTDTPQLIDAVNGCPEC